MPKDFDHIASANIPRGFFMKELFFIRKSELAFAGEIAVLKFSFIDTSIGISDFAFAI